MSVPTHLRVAAAHDNGAANVGRVVLQTRFLGLFLERNRRSSNLIYEIIL